MTGTARRKRNSNLVLPLPSFNTCMSWRSVEGRKSHALDPSWSWCRKVWRSFGFFGENFRTALSHKRNWPWSCNQRDEYESVHKGWAACVQMEWLISRCYVTIGVATQYPEPEARDQYARRHRFWRERWFLRREENRRTQWKTLGVRLGSTNHSPRTSPEPGSQLWEAQMMISQSDSP